MKPEEKNNIYHYILNIIRNSDLPERDKAKEITLFVDSLILQKEEEFLEKEDMYGGDGRPKGKLPTFGKTFRRAE